MRLAILIHAVLLLATISPAAVVSDPTCADCNSRPSVPRVSAAPPATLLNGMKEDSSTQRQLEAGAEALKALTAMCKYKLHRPFRADFGVEAHDELLGLLSFGGPLQASAVRLQV